jgi:cell division protease FtsH
MTQSLPPGQQGPHSRPPQGPPHAAPPTPSWPPLLILALMLAGMWFWQSRSMESPRPIVDYSQFYDWVEAGQVESLLIRGQSATGELKSAAQVNDRSIQNFQTTLPTEDNTLLPKLREKGVRIRVASEERPFGMQLILSLAPWLLIFGLWFFLSKRLSRAMGAGGPLGGFMKQKGRKFEKSTSVNVTFDDVAGLKAAKRDLQEIVQFLKQPEQFKRLGGKIPRGVLLIGPPGTGKTLLARAVAGESGVSFFSISASEFIEMFVGVGAARVRELFAEAKKSEPAIVFIDEIDAVGRSRGAGLGGGHDEREQTLNQLLSEMDGFDRNDRTVVLAATNRPDVLDPALLRPGRFDRRVIVDRPELQARQAILQVHTRGKPLEGVDLCEIAKNTPGFSGADLANLVNEAALHATRRQGDAITPADFAAAYDKIVLGDPREAKLDVDEKRRVAVHESGHAIVAQSCNDSEPLNRVSIIPRGMALGVTQQTPAADRHIMTKSQLESRLSVLMGGYAAEGLVLGDISTGAENDLKKATELASKMVAHYGMSPQIGPVYYEHGAEHPFLGQRIATDSGASDATISAIEVEARKILAAALERAQQLIRANRAQFDKLVAALLEHETLEKDDLAQLLGDGQQSQPQNAAQ